MADNDWEIVPERDDALLKSRKGKQPEGRSSGEQKSGSKVARKNTGSGDSMALWSFIFLLVFASLGANVYLYLTLTDMRAESLAMDTRVLDVESKLDVTDESFTASAASIQSAMREHAGELELHMSEIRKLWAIYQRYDPVISDLQKKLDQNAQSLQQLSQQLTGRVAATEKRLEASGSQALVLAADVEEMSARVREVRDSMNSQRTTIQQLQNLQKEQAEAIEAIDAFRLQINQRILRLENPGGA